MWINGTTSKTLLESWPGNVYLENEIPIGGLLIIIISMFILVAFSALLSIAIEALKSIIETVTRCSLCKFL